jgi:DNA invertase Pin-like site-specific DNA recombinase
VSTDRQVTDNQRFEILKFADEKKWMTEERVEETVDGTKNMKERTG